MNNKAFKHLNIENLMPSDNKNYNNTKGVIDINMISSDKAVNSEPHKDFNSINLLDNIYERRIQKRNWLVSEFNRCCEQIKNANNLGLTDIFFSIPEIIVENSSYKHKDALEYISKNLREQKLDTYIVNNRTLFVTWKYLELNLI
jgi:hypothetical protein